MCDQLLAVICGSVTTVPPSVVNISRDVRKHVDDDVILKCDVVGTPQPQITWFKVRGDIEKSNS